MIEPKPEHEPIAIIGLGCVFAGGIGVRFVGEDGGLIASGDVVPTA